MTSTDDPPLLAATDVAAGYSSIPVIHEIALQVRAGEVVVLIGPNGAGKTTTLRTLSGQIKPMRGTISWKGSRTSAPLYRRSRDGLAFVGEERSVFPSLSTADNLRLGSGGIGPAIELMPELRPLLRRRAGLLSGGEQQMLSLARALAGNPTLLLADELSLGLAPMISSRLLRAVRDAVDKGIGALLVEQHVRQVLTMADRGYIMQRGRIVMEGTARELTERLKEVEGFYLS
jgi:branched-chain amino acid transport system ATP-binding protein